MRFNLVLGICAVGVQLAKANVVPEYHKQHHEKTKWITEIRKITANPFPSNWADGWGPNQGNPENHHKGSKHAHDNANNNDGKKNHHEKSKHPKPTPVSRPNKEHHPVHDPTHHKSKHHNDKPTKSKPNSPAHTQTRAQGSPPGSTPPSYSGLGGTYQQQVIKNHNVHRSNHSAAKITWSDSLAATAAKIASGCVFAHVMGQDGGGYGQNIAAGAPEAAISHVISDQFYNAEVNYFAGQYGDSNPTGFEHWGHFSQLVWKNTAVVGCSTQYCPGGVGNTGQNVPPYFTVCNYHPPGNVGGGYATNIGKPLGRPTVRGHGAKGNHQ